MPSACLFCSAATADTGSAPPTPEELVSRGTMLGVFVVASTALTPDHFCERHGREMYQLMRYAKTLSKSALEKHLGPSGMDAMDRVFKASKERGKG